MSYLFCLDRQSPTITCPSDIVEVTADSSLRVTWEDAIAEDNADPAPAVTYSPQQSGTVFQANGESVSIIARATDSSANYQECVFQVTIYQRGKFIRHNLAHLLHILVTQ